MDPDASPPLKIFIPTALLFSLAGWGGIAWLVLFAKPLVGPRWLFFLCWFLALTGPALLALAFLHRRFPTPEGVSQDVVVREAIFVGLYGSTLAWLQIGRVATLPLALLLGGGLVLIEWFIRLREKSRWKK